MPKQPRCAFDRQDPEPSPADPVMLRDLLAHAIRDPWLASLQARRLTTLRERLGEVGVWLASLPRRMRRSTARRWATALPIGALLLALAAGPAHANTITVVGGGGNCSLAEAIGNANDTTTGQPNADCGDGDETGADTIQFQYANKTYSYAAALPDITTEMTIQGNGNTTIQRTGGPMFSVLVVQSGDLTLNDATISGGDAPGYGGGLFVRGTLTLNNSVISGNSAQSGGGIGGINGTMYIMDSVISGNFASYDGGAMRFTNEAGYNATVHLTRTTVSGNTASRDGGGLYSQRCSISIVDSTLSGNTGRFGGGIYGHGAGMTISGSTISGNSARSDGGGIYSSQEGTVSLTNSTVSGNTASDAGGGIRSNNAELRLRHSTVTGNSAADGSGINTGSFGDGLMDAGGSIIADQVAGVDCVNTGTITSSGYNLEGGTSCGFTMASDIQNGNADLGPLLDNGGPTHTHALGAASDALDNASNAMCAAAPVNGVDQRGVTRPQPGGGTCDIGAFEAGAAFTLNVVIAGAGSGTVSSAPPGIACPGDCSEGPFDGQDVTLTPTAAPGSVFAGWSGDCTGSGPAVVEMLDDRSCTATFNVAPPTPTPAPPAPPTAAQVTHFAAAPDPTGRVRILWETASEVDVVGFRLQRAPSANGPWRTVGGLIPARGSAAGGTAYAATDAPGVGRFAYRLEVLSPREGPQTFGPVEAVVRTLRAFLPVGWR